MNLLLVLLLLTTAVAHGTHGTTDGSITLKPEGISWSDWHMREEHSLDHYDADTFFNLHDLQSRGQWGRNDILYLYGLMRDLIVGDGSGMGEHTSHDHEMITDELKDYVVEQITKLVDPNSDGIVTIEEWRTFINNGGVLPDFGYGQGHHLDFEKEYEEHHWKKYHSQDDPDVLIKHKEDIMHEMLHHEHDIEETHDKAENRKFTKQFLSDIKMHNLPAKYLRA